MIYVLGYSDTAIEACKSFNSIYDIDYRIVTNKIDVQDKEIRLDDLWVAVQRDNYPIIMKGGFDTKTFMRIVLSHLDTKSFLYHICRFIHPMKPTLYMTDGALNIHMNMEQKVKATKGLADFIKKCGDNPIVGLITPSGEINPKIQSSIDALYVYNQLNTQYQMMIGSFDTLLSIENAKHKNIVNQTEEANCLICDNLDQANTLWKSLTMFGDFTVAGLVLGAPFPIVLTSRNDTYYSKLESLKLAYNFYNKEGDK